MGQTANTCGLMWPHRAVWWRGAEWRHALTTGSSVDLLVALEANTFRGRTSLQLKVEDARPGEAS